MFIEKSDNPIEPFKSNIYMKIGLTISVAGIFLTGVLSFIYEYLISVSAGL